MEIHTLLWLIAGSFIITLSGMTLMMRQRILLLKKLKKSHPEILERYFKKDLTVKEFLWTFAYRNEKYTFAKDVLFTKKLFLDNNTRKIILLDRVGTSIMTFGITVIFVLTLII